MCNSIGHKIIVINNENLELHVSCFEPEHEVLLKPNLVVDHTLYNNALVLYRYCEHYDACISNQCFHTYTRDITSLVDSCFIQFAALVDSSSNNSKA